MRSNGKGESGIENDRLMAEVRTVANDSERVCWMVGVEVKGEQSYKVKRFDAFPPEKSIALFMKTTAQSVELSLFDIESCT
jgi:hypothetical protein